MRVAFDQICEPKIGANLLYESNETCLLERRADSNQPWKMNRSCLDRTSRFRTDSWQVCCLDLSKGLTTQVLFRSLRSVVQNWCCSERHLQRQLATEASNESFGTWSNNFGSRNIWETLIFVELPSCLVAFVFRLLSKRWLTHTGWIFRTENNAERNICWIFAAENRISQAV